MYADLKIPKKRAFQPEVLEDRSDVVRYNIGTRNGAVKYRITVKPKDIQPFLEDAGLRRIGRLVFDRYNNKIGTVRVAIKKRIFTERKKQNVQQFYAEIIIIQPLTGQTKSNNLVTDKTKPKSVMANPKSENKKMRFNDFPEDVKQRMNAAHNLRLITRLQHNEPFEKVAKSCLPEFDSYFSQFKNADPDTLATEAKRLRASYRF